MYKFTVFCQHESGGTIHINTVEVAEADHTKVGQEGRAICAQEWGNEESEILVLGIFEGSVSPVMWEDTGIRLPTLMNVKIDFDAWPGASFQGGRIIELEPYQFRDFEQFTSALDDVEELLEGLAEDDGGGDMLEQIRTAALDVWQAWSNESREVSRQLVLASGRTDEAGKLVESFDISVSIRPTVETR